MYDLVCKEGRTHSFQVQIWREGYERSIELEKENRLLKDEIANLKAKELVRKALYDKR